MILFVYFIYVIDTFALPNVLSLSVFKNVFQTNFEYKTIFTTMFFVSLDLPQSYLYQMVAMSFVDGPEHPVIPVDRDRSGLNTMDVKRLFKAHGSFMKFMTFTDEVPREEQKEKEELQLKKEKVRIFTSHFADDGFFTKNI